jgi:hypothetical protein
MNGHNSFLNTVEPRVAAALALRLVTPSKTAPTEAAALPAYLTSLVESCAAFITAQGWRTAPPFPGRSAGLAVGPSGWHVTYATELWTSNDKVGVVFLAVAAGRAPLINVGPPSCHIPEDWNIIAP